VRILLMGNPNVGKSAVFAHLTGVDVVASNYPGTTVECSRGHLILPGGRAELIDVPGTYSLYGSCPAEDLALALLPTADLVINVVDASNLGRNLSLTLQLLEMGTPVVVLLNLWDEARRKGKYINESTSIRPGWRNAWVSPWSQPSLWPVGDWIGASAVSQRPSPGPPPNAAWRNAGPWRDGLRERCRYPPGWSPGRWNGWRILPCARFAGCWWLSSPCRPSSGPSFSLLYQPFLLRLSTLLGGSGPLHDLLLGPVSGPFIDFESSLGLLSTGVYVPLGLVLPYVASFYLVLGLLEDVGYLPRIAVLCDRALQKLGLSGYASIPLMLGVGCNVPGVLATRTLSSRRERSIACVMLAICTPCTAQLALILALVGRWGPSYLAVTFTALFALAACLGRAADHILPGAAPVLLMEIPPFRRPSPRAQVKKLSMRLRGFIHEGVPYVLAGILLMNLLDALGLVEAAGRFLRPVFVQLWGLPEQAVSALFIGLLRKDAAMVLLQPLRLTPLQTVVASVVLTVYFPCAATVGVLLRELGLRSLLRAALVMAACALAVGTGLRCLLSQGWDPALTAGALLATGLFLLYPERGRRP